MTDSGVAGNSNRLPFVNVSRRGNTNGRGALTLTLCPQMTSMFEKLSSSNKQLEEEMKELADRKESVAHWETQITEIIQWCVSA